MAIVIKSAGELALMRKAGAVVAAALAELARAVRPGSPRVSWTGWRRR